MGQVKKRNELSDIKLKQILISQVEYSKQISELVADERRKIIDSLKDFVIGLASNSLDGEQLKLRLNLKIQEIRVFLICSEFYFSPFIQSLHKFARERIKQGLPTKISIYAAGIDDSYFLDFDLPKELIKGFGTKLVEIIILDNPKFRLEILVDGQEVDSFNLTNSATIY